MPITISVPALRLNVVCETTEQALEVATAYAAAGHEVKWKEGI